MVLIKVNPNHNIYIYIYISSRSEVVFKKGVLKNFGKFTGKHESLFFNKATGWGGQLYEKKRLRKRCFPVNFAKFLRTVYFIEHLRWLLLDIEGLNHESIGLTWVKTWC